jgi:drug/metabolite transporter (DMT)-like permease
MLRDCPQGIPALHCQPDNYALLPVRVKPQASFSTLVARRVAVAHRHTRLRVFRLPAVWRGMLWVALSGLLFSCLNATVRNIALSLDPFESQFLRYLFGVVAMLPLVWRHGLRSYLPVSLSGQFWRGAVHTLGLTLWFVSLPHLGLADMTAIGFTGPIFIMLGAAWFLGEKMRADRWIAAAIGFAGVLVVVAPKFTAQGGGYALVMLASSPVFAASFLMTKTLTRYETSGVIVLWQAITVTLLSLPLSLLHWTTPSLWQWVGFAAAGVLGSLGHYCLTRGFRAADISATQSLRFLDLIWASLMGWMVFADIPSHTTLAGALIILMSTVWIARREHQR